MLWTQLGKLQQRLPYTACRTLKDLLGECQQWNEEDVDIVLCRVDKLPDTVMRALLPRIADSIPSPSTSTFSSPSASISSLSHCKQVLSGMAVFSIGHNSDSGPREMTNPPTCCERCLGKPKISVTSSVSNLICGPLWIYSELSETLDHRFFLSTTRDYQRALQLDQVVDSALYRRLGLLTVFYK